MRYKALYGKNEQVKPHILHNFNLFLFDLIVFLLCFEMVNFMVHFHLLRCYIFFIDYALQLPIFIEFVYLSKLIRRLLKQTEDNV